MKKLLFTTTLLFTLFIGASSALAQGLVDTWDTSSPNVCDGGAFITDSLNVTETSIYWAGSGSVLQQGGFYINNLCPGTYTVTYSLNGTTITETFTIIGGSGSPCAGFYVNLDSTPSSGGFLCDGTAQVTTFGGTAPYAYLWDNGSTSSTSVNLCESVYYVTVTDANGCTVTGSVYVPNNGDSTLVIDNTGGYDSTNINGSIGSNWIEDCEIDFGAIDSAFIQNGVINNGTIDVTWVLVDSNGVIVNTYTETYIIGDSLNGNYTVAVTIFCPQRVSGVNNIEIVDVITIDQVAGISDEQEIEFSVSNPFNEEMIVRFNSATDRTITLIDMTGAIVMSSMEKEQIIRLNTSILKNGMYILNVSDSNGIATKKLIKL